MTVIETHPVRLAVEAADVAARLPVRKPASLHFQRRRGGETVDWLSLSMAVVTLVVGTVIAFLISGTSGSGVALVMATVGLLVMVGTFVKSEIGLMALVFMVYTNLSDTVIRYHGLPSVIKPFLALVAAVIFARWVMHRLTLTGIMRPVTLIALYGLASAASLFYAASPSLALAGLDDFLRDAGVAVVVFLLLQTPEKLRRTIWVLVVVGLLLGTLSVWQYLTGDFANNYGGFARAVTLAEVG
ncbi:MAG: hypothetical protein KA764_12140, partial [Anaerolineales bacterium]|nr:hypothetical protein [Anaerolineales bacterium]